MPAPLWLTQVVLDERLLKGCSVCAGQKAAVDSESAEASRQLDSINDRFQPVQTSTNRLSTIFLSLVAWVAVITVLLAVIVTVTCRRRRHRRSASLDAVTSDSISSCSVPELAH